MSFAAFPAPRLAVGPGRQALGACASTRFLVRPPRPDPSPTPAHRDGAPPVEAEAGDAGSRPPPSTGQDRRGRRVTVGVSAVSDETRDRVMEAVRAVVTRSDVISFRVDADMGLYAAHSPRDMNLLLRPAPEPHPRSILLDLDGGIQPDDAAVLGFLAYLPPGCPPERLLYCLESVLRGFSYAPEPWDRWFHHGRERGILTVEERRILSVYGRGRSHERVAEQVGLSAPTYRRRLAGIRRKLQLQPREDLRLVAMARLGYG